MLRNSFIEISISNLFIICWICKFAFMSCTFYILLFNRRHNLICPYCTSTTNSFWIIVAFSSCLSTFEFIKIYWTRCWIWMSVEQSLKKVSRICNSILSIMDFSTIFCNNGSVSSKFIPTTFLCTI